MMGLRGTLLGIFGGLTLLLLVGCWFQPALMGFTFFMALATAAIAFECRRYGAASARNPGSGWVRTEEHFFDDASGQLVDVWYDPASGERHYLKAKQS